MRLGELLDGMPGELRGESSWLVSGLAYDSRMVRPGNLFVCIRGFNFDGHNFAAEARERGAGGLVVERWLDVALPQYKVDDAREALGMLSAVFFERPSEKLKLVGVTGTNGKTTTTYLLESIFRAVGWKTGLVGTVETRMGDKPLPSLRTTPESLDLQRLLATMASHETQAVAMEVSSHGIHLRRHSGCRFDALVFTNLSQDHLDFHGHMESYLQAKLELFTDPAAHKPGLVVAVNLDDPAGRHIASKSLGQVIGFGVEAKGEIAAEEIRESADGVAFRLLLPGKALPISLKLNGRFNVYNALGAAAAAHGIGIEAESIAAGLEGIRSVPGRMEKVEAGQGFLVYVDYAHTPDALRQAILAARSGAPGGKTFVVFGCGGDRDRGKRPQMGRIASELAHVTVITSDNPRSEDPQAIIEEILTGTTDRPAHVETIADRTEAIRYALSQAQAGDAVLIAGKGHESGQTAGARTVPFDDRQVAKEALEELWIRSPSKI